VLARASGTGPGDPPGCPNPPGPGDGVS
jgi:hypothetical protein